MKQPASRTAAVVSSGPAEPARELATLRDGSSVALRPIRPEDREMYVAAVGTLSDHARYLRFGTPKHRFSERELTYLTDVDHRTHEAIVALDAVTGRPLGIARYVAVPDRPGVAEVAITVDDSIRRVGLGTVLTARVMRAARAAGYTRLLAVTLAENRPAREMLRALGFRAARRDGTTVEYEAG